MNVQEIEYKLRELLLPVFGLDGIEEILPEHSLVRDLGAESLDFVEIMYVIERNFDVVLKTKEIILGGSTLTEENIFEDGTLTQEGAVFISQKFPAHAETIQAGVTKVELYSMITVHDMAAIIHSKMIH